jgi:hypothetical protein
VVSKADHASPRRSVREFVRRYQFEPDSEPPPPPLDPEELVPPELPPPPPLEVSFDGSRSGITDSTAPTTVPAVVATAWVTVSATDPTRSATLRTTERVWRLVGIFRATFLAVVATLRMPRRAIDRILLRRAPPRLELPRRDELFLVLLRVAFFVAFLVAFFVALRVLLRRVLFLVDLRVAFFVPFFAMPAPCEVARVREMIELVSRASV